MNKCLNFGESLDRDHLLHPPTPQAPFLPAEGPCAFPPWEFAGFPAWNALSSPISNAYFCLLHVSAQVSFRQRLFPCPSHMKALTSVFLVLSPLPCFIFLHDSYTSDAYICIFFVVYHLASLTGTHCLSKLVLIFVLCLAQAPYLELHVVSGIQQALRK